MSEVYTMEDITLHSKPNSMWIAIENEVYDITTFPGDHPGGPEPLKHNAGTDATQAFLDIGHSANARKLLLQYKIGLLHKKDHKHILPSPLAPTLGYRRSSNQQRVTKDERVTSVKMVFLFFVVAFGYLFFLLYSS